MASIVLPTAFIHKNSYSVSAEETLPRRTVQQDVFSTTGKNRERSIDALGYQDSAIGSQGNSTRQVEQAKVSSIITSYHPIYLLGIQEKFF